ncbi:hypothetical protein CZ797_10895 [Pseudoalteromonas sp. JB197]|nr:hypothetical protein CZ797_10895 [Pseudoalteromonas sp. JB197]
MLAFNACHRAKANFLDKSARGKLPPTLRCTNKKAAVLNSGFYYINR